MIGRHRRRHGVELVNSHRVGQIGAKFLEKSAHAAQQVIGLAPQRRPAAQTVAGLPFHLRRKPALEIEGFVAVEEHPGSRLHRIGIIDGAANEAR